MGLRQTLPVQTNKTCFMRDLAKKGRCSRSGAKSTQQAICACRAGASRLCKRLPMSEIPAEPALLETAWQYALLCTGCRQGADSVLKAAVEDILKHPDAGDPGRRKRLLFGTVRRRSLRFPAKIEVNGAAARMHKLAEPGRSALALLYLDAMPAEEIRRVLELDEAGFSAAVEKSRNALKTEGAQVA